MNRGWTLRLIGGGLVVVLASVAPAAAQSQVQVSGLKGDPLNLKVGLDMTERTISVVGTGTISAAPDVADINVGVVTQAPTAREALSANNEAMAALLGVVKERGVAAKDVQTSNINVNPQYSQPPQQFPGQPQREAFVPRIVAYEVTNSVRITARDLTKLGELLDAVVSAGANRINGISFRIAKPEPLLDQARKEAMANARHKAELLAGEADVVLGPPISISEQGAAPPPPRPMMYRAMAMESAAVPVAAGEQELTTTVNVTYELREPK